MDNKNEFHAYVLGALLHDIGKIYLGKPLSNEFKEEKLKGHGHAKWSADFIKRHDKLWEDVSDIIDMVLYHGQPEKQKDYKGQIRDENKILKALLISIADKLSSMERREEDESKTDEETEKERTERSETPLLSVFNEVNLGLNEIKNPKKAYNLNPLAIKRDILFPLLNYPDEKLSSDSCSRICDNLDIEFNTIKSADDITILFLLYKYIWACPSATPAVGIRPDISLYDHARTTAAIAVCLYKNYKLWTNNKASMLNRALIENYKIKSGKSNTTISSSFRELLDENLFILLAADMFGIQDYIYAPSNIPGTSKRLRGRSFYLLLLTELVARYIIYHPELNLSLVNILYCSGGNFQILLPALDDIYCKLSEIIGEINKKLYKIFKGRIGFVFAMEKITPSQFDTWDEVLKRIDDKISFEKKKKMQNLLKECQEDVLLPKNDIEGRKDICKSCDDTIPYSEDEEKKICLFCNIHKEIGEKLPKLEAIAFYKGKGNIESKNEHFETYKIDFWDFGNVDLIIKKNGLATKPQLRVIGDISHLEYYKLNDTEHFTDSAEIENAQASFGFKFIGNVVPFDENGSVMEFEKIAENSEGAKKLGILKMDVDNLGLILQIGLSSIKGSGSFPSDRTISRLATISRMIDLYFSGYIHNICKSFKNIYLIYSGGDDLLIVGPWNEIPYLANQIYNDFRDYTCRNNDITLSAGILLCDPKFPVKRFAPLVSDELNKSKAKKDKDCCTFFGETIKWSRGNEDISFTELIDFGEELYNLIEAGKVARVFVHELLKMNYLYFSTSKRKKFLYLPRLIWQITRNINDKEIREKLFEKLITHIEGIKWMENIKIPASYALMKSKRGGKNAREIQYQ
jgi:CRISPR-associated protein Csm1